MFLFFKKFVPIVALFISVISSSSANANPFGDGYEYFPDTHYVFRGDRGKASCLLDGFPTSGRAQLSIGGCLDIRSNRGTSGHIDRFMKLSGFSELYTDRYRHRVETSDNCGEVQTDDLSVHLKYYFDHEAKVMVTMKIVSRNYRGGNCSGDGTNFTNSSKATILNITGATSFEIDFSKAW